MTDFEVVEVVDFPRYSDHVMLVLLYAITCNSGGSEFTPAHRHKDFKFKDYSPVAFRLVY